MHSTDKLGNKVHFSLHKSFLLILFSIEFNIEFTLRSVMFYLSDPTSSVSCGSASLEFFDVKRFLCACKLYSEIHPQIRRVLTCPHSLPSIFLPAVPDLYPILLTLYIKFDSLLIFFLSPYEAITLFWFRKQNQTCKTRFCPVSQ